ncbi:MAG: hypothetical protein GKS00_19540 [Alphaproteobacteria bacterium]|nr:hypothetical protein [Alphaproteobacteria bacterium]
MRQCFHDALTFVSFIEERLGNRFAPLVSTYLTANQVTALSAISIPGALIMAQGGYVMMLLGAIIFYFGRWLDYLDGPVARYTGKVSQFGQDLDTVITGISQSVLFIGLGLLWGGDYAIMGWIGGVLSIVIRIVHRTRNFLLPKGHPTLKQQAHRYLWMRSFFVSVR